MEAPSGGSTGTTRPRRTRNRTGQSRNGCSRCKLRRVKCDEHRPACGNCVKLGHQCPGFHPELRWSRKHERAGPASSDSQHPALANDQDAGLEGHPRTGAEGMRSAGPETLPNTWSDLLDGFELPLIDVDPYLAAMTNWDAMAQGADAWPHGSWDSTNAIGAPGEPQVDSGPVTKSLLGALRAPAHLPTVLIEHWFSSVCPTWSTFDSEVNYNRQLAWGAWSMSDVVFYAMQAMSATCLVDSVPHLAETLPSLRTQAASAIECGIAQAKRSEPPAVTAELVFAVLAIGTSLHWSNPGLSEYPWPEVARDLLSAWQVEPSTPDALLHAYFCQAVTYWDMLLAPMNRGSMPAKLDRRRRKMRGELHRALRLPGDETSAAVDGPLPAESIQHVPGTRPNSWCGVSDEVVEKFGEVLALCSACHHGESRHRLNLATTSSGLLDIALAHELRRDLLALDFGVIISTEELYGYCVQTRDITTPLSHLLQTAEAHRQAALLQLYMAFDDLPTLLATAGHESSSHLAPDHPPEDRSERDRRRAESLVAMALHIVGILEQIPVDSGSRSMHPMLYLSAAAGLKFISQSTHHNDFHLPGGSSGYQESLPLQANQPAQGSVQTEADLSGNTHQRAPATPDPSAAFVPKSALEIARSRRFVSSRLGTLQQSMPQSINDNIVDLVKSIWNAYDNSTDDCSSQHWFKVLRHTRRGTMFR